MFYYRGLKEWDNEKGYLIDTCLTAQDRYKACLDYFRIAYFHLSRQYTGNFLKSLDLSGKGKLHSSVLDQV